MKRILLAPVILMCAARMSAQTNEPVRLALLAEADGAAAAADVLTAELSRREDLQLIERNEIERVYREQGLSAGNADYLKLGRILGADGLLILSAQKGGTNSATLAQAASLAGSLTGSTIPTSPTIEARLVAVKPGVVLGVIRSVWSPTDAAHWAGGLASHFAPDFAKLGVLTKDAIPVSVVNLRSAVSSPGSQEAERQLTLLTIERLSRQRELFVLERRRMDLLGTEKELKLDDSAFWSGSYLLDGIVDQAGYSGDTITINARLTPPKGGKPLLIEAGGSRTNFGEAVEQLAARVNAALNLHPTVRAWKAGDEAEQFFVEATWALKWNLRREALAAAESAWALGKRDVDCAVVRVRAWLAGVTADLEDYRHPHIQYDGADVAPTYADAYLQEIVATHPGRVAFERRGNRIDILVIPELPDPEQIDAALRALNFHLDLSRTSLRGKAAEDPAWREVGVQALLAASRLLQCYHSLPEARPAVADKLASLRGAARSVAAWISGLPSVRDAYWVGDRAVTRAEIERSIGERTNVFRCQLNWGGFWQERPEDAVALYRELLSSPTFCYIHRDLWVRPPHRPRLTAWNAGEAQRIPEMWRSFVQELAASSNTVLRLEGLSMQLAEADNDADMERAFNALFETLFSQREFLLTNNVDLLHANWGGFGVLDPRQGVTSRTRERLEQRYNSELRPKVEALRQEYEERRDRLRAEQEQRARSDKLQQLISRSNPEDFPQLYQTYLDSRETIKAHAAALRPMLGSYRSNLLAQVQRTSGRERNEAQIRLSRLQLVESAVNLVLTPPSSSRGSGNAASRPVPVIPAPASVEAAAPVAAAAVPEPLLVREFVRIPWTFPQPSNAAPAQPVVSSCRSSGGKLLLELRGKPTMPRNVGNFNVAVNGAVAIFDPRRSTWDIVDYPAGLSTRVALEYVLGRNFGAYSALFQGRLYLSDQGRVMQCDLSRRQWQTLAIPGHERSQLFAIGEHLYAANDENIVEVTEGGRGTRVLASVRRRPAASALDSLETLGSPALIAGPNGSLRTVIGSKVFAWNGRDWSEACTVEASEAPDVFADAALFRSLSLDGPPRLWILAAEQPAPELCLLEPAWTPSVNLNFPLNKPGSGRVRPLWSTLEDERLVSSSATVFKSDLYFLVEHCARTNRAGRVQVLERDGYHAKLVCLIRGLGEPVVLPLRFDAERGQPPINTEDAGPGWLRAGYSPDSILPLICFAEDFLFIAQANSRGIWRIPTARVNLALAGMREAATARAERAKPLSEPRRKAVLAKYDKNRNGVIDPEEKVEAIHDPEFVKYELERIHNRQ